MNDRQRGRIRRVAAAAPGLGATIAMLATAVAVPPTANAALRSAASICTAASAANRGLAARLSRDILSAVAGRSSTVALKVADFRKGITCTLQETQHFDSASVVKVTILGALLRMKMEQHQFLTAREDALSHAMIERSDNAAASALWAEVGHGRLQHFLDLAKMGETRLGPGGFWGLTQITAHDELLLLELLVFRNSVLDDASRFYARDLMHHVIASQRWGVPAGAPAGVIVHVKNGWVPISPHGWRVNSIGSFSGSGKNYMIVVLTQDNPTMAYGVRTIEDAAVVIHRDLNSGQAAAIAPSVISPSQAVPDEQLPASLSSP